MVVNQKSKFAMKHDLSLFLGKIVDEFVNWLFDFLAQLKMNVSETNDEENESKHKYFCLVIFLNKSKHFLYRQTREYCKVA